MPKTPEELESELAQANASLAAAQVRIKEVNDEAKGHRLNGDNFRTQAERAAKEAADAKSALEAKSAEIAAEKARLENDAAEKVKAADSKATDAITKAQQRAINADLKVAAKDAGAHDVAAVLKLIDASAVKLNDDGDVTNATELLAEFKKANAWAFGVPSTSSTTAPPPPKQTDAKTAKDMTAEEYRAARDRIRRGQKV